MISSGVSIGAPALPLSTKAILAGSIMADDDDNDINEKPTMKSDFDPDGKGKPFFGEGDFDIYINKVTEETYIFHGPDLTYPVERLEYNPDDYSVNVIGKDGQSRDLGVKIQWLIRPYFSKAKTVFIMKTKDGEVVDGIDVPLVVKESKEGEA